MPSLALPPPSVALNYKAPSKAAPAAAVAATAPASNTTRSTFSLVLPPPSAALNYKNPSGSAPIAAATAPTSNTTSKVFSLALPPPSAALNYKDPSGSAPVATGTTLTSISNVLSTSETKRAATGQDKPKSAEKDANKGKQTKMTPVVRHWFKCRYGCTGPGSVKPNASSLRQHMERTHNLIPEEKHYDVCLMCKRKYSSKAQYEEHYNPDRPMCGESMFSEKVTAKYTAAKAKWDVMLPRTRQERADTFAFEVDGPPSNTVKFRNGGGMSLRGLEDLEADPVPEFLTAAERAEGNRPLPTKGTKRKRDSSSRGGESSPLGVNAEARLPASTAATPQQQIIVPAPMTQQGIWSSPALGLKDWSSLSAPTAVPPHQQILGQASTPGQAVWSSPPNQDDWSYLLAPVAVQQQQTLGKVPMPPQQTFLSSTPNPGGWNSLPALAATQQQQTLGMVPMPPRQAFCSSQLGLNGWESLATPAAALTQQMLTETEEQKLQQALAALAPQGPKDPFFSLGWGHGSF